MTDAPTTSAPRPHGKQRWRAWVSTLVIVVAAILVPVSIVTAWARVQLTDEDAFARVYAPLAQSAPVQELVVSQAMTAIREQVDFAELTGAVFDGVKDLGVDPRAAAALDMLKQPAADGVADLVESTLASVVESEAFATVWDQTVRGAHRALTLASTSDGAGVFVQTADGLGVKLGPIIAQVKAQLTERGVGLASMIPAIDKTIIVSDGQTLMMVRLGYATTTAVGWWLPVITLALFGLGIAIARRRGAAVLGSGIALLIGGASLGTVLNIGATAAAMASTQLGLSPRAIDVIYWQLITSMHQTSWTFALVGAVVAVTGWLMGRSRPARAIRAAAGSVTNVTRSSLRSHGMHTGALGSWLARYHVLVRVCIGIGATLWLFAMRPITTANIVLVVVTALLLGFVLSVLDARDPAAEAGAQADADGTEVGPAQAATPNAVKDAADTEASAITDPAGDDERDPETAPAR